MFEGAAGGREPALRNWNSEGAAGPHGARARCCVADAPLLQTEDGPLCPCPLVTLSCPRQVTNTCFSTNQLDPGPWKPRRAGGAVGGSVHRLLLAPPVTHIWPGADVSTVSSRVSDGHSRACHSFRCPWGPLVQPVRWEPHCWQSLARGPALPFLPHPVHEV